MTGHQVTQAVAAEVRILQFAFFEFVFCISYFVFFLYFDHQVFERLLNLVVFVFWKYDPSTLGRRDRKMLKSNIVIPSSPRSSLTSFNPMYVGLYVG